MGLNSDPSKNVWADLDKPPFLQGSRFSSAFGGHPLCSSDSLGLTLRAPCDTCVCRAHRGGVSCPGVTQQVNGRASRARGEGSPRPPPVKSPTERAKAASVQWSLWGPVGRHSWEYPLFLPPVPRPKAGGTHLHTLTPASPAPTAGCHSGHRRWGSCSCKP